MINEIDSIKKTPLYFLISFGHCGIDWIHSLFDSHKDILITPAFSFYKSWKIINAADAYSVDEMHEKWIDYFQNDSSMQSKETKLFSSSSEFERFSVFLFNNLSSKQLNRVNTFYSIQKSYMNAKNIEWKPKIIISEEHVNVPLKTLVKDFPESKIIFLVRDPRAAISGYVKLFSKKYKDFPDFFDHNYNLAFEQWLLADEVYQNMKKEKKKFIIIKNESMSKDTDIEMNKICDEIDISFDPILLKKTYSNGGNWTFDSAYADREGNLPNKYRSEKQFLDSKLIRKRWLNELTKMELLIIENLFSSIMTEFNYNFESKISPLSKFKSKIYFLFSRLLINKRLKYNYDLNELDRYFQRLKIKRKFLLIIFYKYSPNFVKKWTITIDSILTKFSIIYLNGDRWKRYDNGYFKL